MIKTLRSRFLVAATAVAIVIAILTSAAFLYRQQVEAKLDEDAVTRARSSVLVGELSRTVGAVPLWTRIALQDAAIPGSERVRQDREAHDSMARALDQARVQYAEMPRDPAEAQAWRSFLERYAAMRVTDELVWSALADGDTALARNRLADNDRATAAVSASVAVLANLYDSTAVLDTMRTAQIRSAIVLVLTLLGCTGMALFAIRAYANSLTSRLHGLNAGALRMAEGALDVQFIDHTPDELGDVNRTLQEVVAFKQRLARVAGRVAVGDIAVDVPSRGSNDAFAGAINEIVLSLRELAEKSDLLADSRFPEIRSRDPNDRINATLQRLSDSLRVRAAEVASVDWLKTGIARINTVVLGQTDLQVLAAAAISALAEHLGAQVGALYVVDADDGGALLRLAGTYAYTRRKHGGNEFRFGDGLVGQVAQERTPIILQQVPEDYVQIVSGLGKATPVEVFVAPVLFMGEVRGVLEIGVLTRISEIQRQFLEQSAIVIGAAFEIARSNRALVEQQAELRGYTAELEGQREELQATSAELKAQQLELQQTNAEVEAQMRRAVVSEEKLKSQQDELEYANRALEGRNTELEVQTAQVENARRELLQQTENLAIASKYKSEFLANMSHELRTPLNSLLLLARSLRDNVDGNLLPGQLESAGIIYDSGKDLLNLINEILDLSKIEAGRMELHVEACPVAEIARSLALQFAHMALSQKLELNVHVAEDAPAEVQTDPNRLGQVLKNLLGNALKFTDKGSVTVAFERVSPDTVLTVPGLTADRALAIRIVDTGIGITPEKQKIIFEAFQQADSGDQRRFGGTGLGLTISRNIAALLGGEIQLTSALGAGSTFTIIIPLEPPPAGSQPAAVGNGVAQKPQAGGVTPRSAPAATLPVQPVADDRDTLEDRDRVILIVEDDLRFCSVLVNEVRRRGFKCLAAHQGEEGIRLAKTFRPGGIILDLVLPGMDGWAVLTALKQDVDTRHIPVHIVSAEDSSLEGLRIGAIGHSHKPLTPTDINDIISTIERSAATAEKHVLVVEDDPVVRRDTVRAVGNGNVHVHEAASGAEALAAMRGQKLDLVVLDLGLEDMQGLELLRAAAAAGVHMPPVIVYTARDLTPAEEMSLRHYAEKIIIKDVRSHERLIDEVALFLHRVVNDLPADKRSTIRHIYESDDTLRGKSVLIVEDDMRTMFAMAKLLAGHGMHPLKAADGSQALAVLGKEQVDLVLLDMMMPVMDGYETATRIRADAGFGKLPIIALTAKAMKEDRQRCIEAGASDYLAKPVDQDRLLSLLRIWMCR